MSDNPPASSDDEANTAELILTSAQAVELCPKPFRFVGKSKGFTAMEDLGSLTELDYFDARDNKLKSVAAISRLQRLKTVILKSNLLTSLDELGALSNIRVLNIAENRLSSLASLSDSSFAPELLVLVAAGNDLTSIAEVSAFPKLTTLVVSHNRIVDLAPVAHLPDLTKLSASYNAISDVPGGLAHLDNLEELRLAHNKLVNLPGKEVMESWNKLRILDVGHNAIENVDAVPVLAASLHTVNFAGNPVAEKEGDAYRALLQGTCPKIEIVDSVRLTGGRKKVREARKVREEAAVVAEKEGEENIGETKSVKKRQKRRGGKTDTVVQVENPDGAVEAVAEAGSTQAETKKTKKKGKDEEVEKDMTSAKVNGEAEKTSSDAKAEKKKKKKKRKLEDVQADEATVEGNDEDQAAQPGGDEQVSLGTGAAELKAKRKKRKKLTQDHVEKKKEVAPALQEKKSEVKKGKKQNRGEKEGSVAPAETQSNANGDGSKQVQYPDGMDDELDAAEFLQRMNAMKESRQGMKKPETSKNEAKRDRKRKKKETVTFGGGGESQW